MLEIGIDTTDAVLMGHDSMQGKLKEVLNTYHLKVNNYKLDKHAYFKGCMLNEACKEIVNMTPAEIINAHVDHTYALTEESMTNEEWEAANEYAEKLFTLSESDHTNDEFYDLIHVFYTDMEKATIEALIATKSEIIASLKADIDLRIADEAAAAAAGGARRLQDEPIAAPKALGAAPAAPIALGAPKAVLLNETLLVDPIEVIPMQEPEVIKI